MNPNAIIIKAKSLEAQLMNHLRHNGGFRDYITDKLDRELAKCSIDLTNTHWTQETEELRRKWRDFHARFCERVRVKLPRSTRPCTINKADFME